MIDQAPPHMTGDVNGSPLAKTDPRVKPQQRGRPQQRANKNAVAIPLLLQKTSPSVPTPSKPFRDSYPCDPPPPTPSSEEIIMINARDRQPPPGQAHHMIRRFTDLEVSSKPESVSGTSTLVSSPSVPLYNKEDGSIAPVLGLSGGLWLVHKSLLDRVPQIHHEDWARQMPTPMSPLNLNASSWLASVLRADGQQEIDGFRPDDGTGHSSIDAVWDVWDAVATGDAWSGSQRAALGSGTSSIDGNWGWATDAQDVPTLDSGTNATHDISAEPENEKAYDLGSQIQVDLQMSSTNCDELATDAPPKLSQAVFQQLEMQLVDPKIGIADLATLLQTPALTQGQLLHLLGHLRTTLLDTLFEIRTLELHFARLSYFGPKYTNRIEAAGKRFQQSASVEFYDSMDEDFIAEQGRMSGTLDTRGVILRHAESFRFAVARLVELRGHDEHTEFRRDVEHTEQTSETIKMKQKRGGVKQKDRKQKGTRQRGRQQSTVAVTEAALPEELHGHAKERSAHIEKEGVAETEHAPSAPASVGSLLRQGKRGVSVPALR
ncbi:hypothetical protein LTR95_004817 [Oleoguttula sp. CCFEE 5521]